MGKKRGGAGYGCGLWCVRVADRAMLVAPKLITGDHVATNWMGWMKQPKLAR